MFINYQNVIRNKESPINDKEKINIDKFIGRET